MENQKNGLHSLLGAHQLLHLLGSQSASTYANQVIAFVIPWLVLTRTGSAVSAGTVAFAMGVAAFFGVLTGGLITDRIGGRRVSIIADLLSTVTALLLGIALFFDFFSLWLVIVSQIIGVFFDGPGQIAKNTMVPSAATENDVPIVRAMGIQQTLQNVANFVGPLSAGLLVALLSESITLMFASVLFAFCIFLVLRLPRQTMVHKNQMNARQAYEDMREAVRFIIKDPFLGPMQIFGPFFAFALGPVSAIVLPAWFVFANQSAAQLGIFLGAQALGGMLGGFIFAAFAPKVSQQKWLFGATGAYALALLACISCSPDRSVVMLVGFHGRHGLYGHYGHPLFFLLYTYAREVTGPCEQPGCRYGLHFHVAGSLILRLAGQCHFRQDRSLSLCHCDGADRPRCFTFPLYEALGREA